MTAFFFSMTSIISNAPSVKRWELVVEYGIDSRPSKLFRYCL